MSQPVLACAAAEPPLTRVLRLVGVVLLVLCSAALIVLTRPVIELVHATTFLRLGVFVAALGTLASSVAAFWWRDAALRRVEWAAYVVMGLLIVEQFAAKSASGPAQPVALVFGLLVTTIVVARVTRPRAAAACNCG